jgi:endonuclease YncB( thermonuclease family)
MSVTLRKRALLLCLISLSVVAACARETAKSVSGKVVKIADGDTITILDAQNVQHRIRLQGIDAPERRQAFGQVSRENLGGLVFGKQVDVEYEKVDRYGRLVGKVSINGDDECLEQIKSGLAWHYKKYENEQSSTDHQLYANAEETARVQKRGLWLDSNPTPPWDFRHHTTGSSADSDSPDEPQSFDVGNPVGQPSARPVFSSSPSSDFKNAPAPSVNLTATPNESGSIRGNKRTMIYHWPGCPNYDDIAVHNRVPFQTREDAARAGYRAARNCR